ncbi:MAG: dATP/dGTP diphosphohydrolase domain-containing protein [Steroidobacteraceae bacterium]
MTLPADSAERKRYPLASGLLDYFPDALAEVSRVSWVGNEKHNPGEPLHHARGKSMDHADCILRHLMQRGEFEDVAVGSATYRVRHSACLVWRALALLQEELEAAGAPLARGAKLAAPATQAYHTEQQGKP